MANITLTNNSNTLYIEYNYNQNNNKFSITNGYITINKDHSANCVWDSGYGVFIDALIKITKWNKSGYDGTSTLLKCSYNYVNGTYTDDSGVTTWGKLGFSGSSDTPRNIQLNKIEKAYGHNYTYIDTINNFEGASSNNPSTWNYTFSNSASNLINIEISISMRGIKNDNHWTDEFFHVVYNQFLVLPESSGKILYSAETNVANIKSGNYSLNLNARFKIIFCIYNINIFKRTANIYACPIVTQTSDENSGTFNSYASFQSYTTPKFYIIDNNKSSNNQINFISHNNSWVAGTDYSYDASNPSSERWDGYSINIKYGVYNSLYAGNTSYIHEDREHLNPNNFLTKVKLNNNGQISLKYGFNFRFFTTVTFYNTSGINVVTSGYIDVVKTDESETITTTDLYAPMPYDGTFAEQNKYIKALNNGTAANNITYSNLKNFDTLREYVYIFTGDSNLATSFTSETQNNPIPNTNLIKPLNKIKELMNNTTYYNTILNSGRLTKKRLDDIKSTTFGQGSVIPALKDYFTIINYLNANQ